MSQNPRQLNLHIALLTVTRIAVNAVYRIPYPFLPVFARGLGVSIETLAIALTVRAAVGILGPLIATLADTRGRKFALILGLTGVIAGSLLIAFTANLSAGLLTFTIATIIISAGKLLFDTASIAYVGDRVPYAARGRSLAIIELAWSSAFLLGMPFAGWIISRSAWSQPYLVFGLMMLVGLVLLIWQIPGDSAAGEPLQRPGVGQLARAVAASPVAQAAILLGLLMMGANELIGISFGAWLEADFGLSIEGLGIAAAVIGMAELAGEALVAVFVDRIGKRRMVMAGIALNALAGLALFLLGNSVGGALTGLFLFYFTFECALVASIPLLSEILPEARATVVAAFASAASVGRGIGAALGPRLFAGLLIGGGILANGIAALLVNGGALFTLWRGLPEEQPTSVD